MRLASRNHGVLVRPDQHLVGIVESMEEAKLLLSSYLHPGDVATFSAKSCAISRARASRSEAFGRVSLKRLDRRVRDAA